MKPSACIELSIIAMIFFESLPDSKCNGIQYQYETNKAVASNNVYRGMSIILARA